MEMVAHNPEKAKQLGVPQSVGEEFVTKDSELDEKRKSLLQKAVQSHMNKIYGK